MKIIKILIISLEAAKRICGNYRRASTAGRRMALTAAIKISQRQRILMRAGCDPTISRRRNRR